MTCISLLLHSPIGLTPTTYPASRAHKGTITPLFHEYFDAEVAELIRKSTALKRLADPIEIANGECKARAPGRALP